MSGLNDRGVLPHSCEGCKFQIQVSGSSLVAPWVKDLALSLLWCGFLAWGLLLAMGGTPHPPPKKKKESKDQGVSRGGFFQGLFPWRGEGPLLPGSPPALPRGCVCVIFKDTSHIGLGLCPVTSFHFD